MLLPKAIQDQKKDALISQMKTFSNESSLLLEFLRKLFADGRCLHGVTSPSRLSQQLACPQSRSVAAWRFVFCLSILTYYTQYLLSKHKQVPYWRIKGKANKTLPPAQYEVLISQLSAIICTRRSCTAQGGTRYQLWRMATCTWIWGVVREGPNPWVPCTQTYTNGNWCCSGAAAQWKSLFQVH